MHWKISCYHYEYYRASTTHKKNYTFHKSGTFKFDSWRDLSAPVDDLVQWDITRVDFEMKTVFANAETSQLYHKSFEKFKKKNWRDEKQEYSKWTTVNGYQNRILAVSNREGLPFGMGKLWYFFFSLFTLSLFYRIWFNSVTGDFDYVFVKEVKKGKGGKEKKENKKGK